MEYVEGITLKKHIDHRGALPEREVIYYATQILSALSYIHSKGIVHCDIKPQNIILLPNGNIKVADFGIARLDAMLDNSKEKSDVALGTVYYVSPEQAQGKAPQAQSDIYSLGVMLYEAMTNRLPFVHDSVDEVARMQINKDPLPPSAYRPEMSIGLEQIILRAMEKSTKNRYASAQEMLTDIRALRQNEKIIFGNEKRSRYRIIDREVYANVPYISNRSFIPLNDKGRGIENNQGAFGRAQRNTSSGTYGSTLKATSSSIRAAQDRSFEISQKNNAPQKNKVNDPQIKEPQRADIQKSKRNSVINDKDIISILLGIIISLAIVIFLSLCIWFIISPGKIACENPQYSITETENNIKWNTEHTERY